MFLILLKIAKYLGFIRNSTRCRLLTIAVNISFLIMYGIMSFITILHLQLFHVNLILTLFQRILEICFLFFCFAIPHTIENDWKLVLSELKQNCPDRNNKFQIMLLLVVHVIIVCVMTVEFYITLQRGTVFESISWVSFHINQYLHFFMSLLIYNGILTIRKKYHRLTKLLVELVRDNIALNTSENYSTVMTAYKKCFLLVQGFSSIFGWHMVTIFGVALHKITATIMFIIHTDNNYRTVYIVTGVLQISLYWASHYSIVVFCLMRTFYLCNIYHLH